MLLSLIAATFTFTATATGVEKGTPIEFFLVGQGSDRDYESLFVLDESIDSFTRRIEAAGFPRGKAVDPKSCIVWPIGPKVHFEPSINEFLEITENSAALTKAQPIYTGGTRYDDGSSVATTNMPSAVFALYSLAQSAIVLDGNFEQGDVYNCQLAKKTLEKGSKVTFTLSTDEDEIRKPLSVKISGVDQIKSEILPLFAQSKTNQVELLVDFADELTVAEMTDKIAPALAYLDSHRFKINGCAKGRLFYKAFQPQVRWLDRQQRLLQPFELTIGKTNRLIRIESDWTVEGLDPKLTEIEIAPNNAKDFPEIETCFIFAHPNTQLGHIYEAIDQLKDSKISIWYVYADNNLGLHNRPYTIKGE